jgi:hypothetical protein
MKSCTLIGDLREDHLKLRDHLRWVGGIGDSVRHGFHQPLIYISGTSNTIGVLEVCPKGVSISKLLSDHMIRKSALDHCSCLHFQGIANGSFASYSSSISNWSRRSCPTRHSPSGDGRTINGAKNQIVLHLSSPSVVVLHPSKFGEGVSTGNGNSGPDNPKYQYNVYQVDHDRVLRLSYKSFSSFYSEIDDIAQ